MTDEKQNGAPLWLDGRYVLQTRSGLIEITASAPRRRRGARWWRGMGADGPLTEWLPSPRAVAIALTRRGR